MKKVNVLIIDDSAVVREILGSKLGQHPAINIVATAVDPYLAREKIAKHQVDVITLDIELPRMDGLTFLKYLMRYYPIPVVVVSSLTDTRNRASLTALELGAVDIVPKPGGPYSVGEIVDLLTDKILAAAAVDFGKVKETARMNQAQLVQDRGKYLARISTTNKVLAIGASTGGTSTLEVLFKSFDRSFPAALTVIHMPERFTGAFADRLDELCRVSVKEAENGERLLPGTIYIAPGNYHMKVRAAGAENTIQVVKGPKVHGQRPAVDVLFHSVAENIGKNAVGVILTGMGRDGAAGLGAIKAQGGYTIAQDERTSIVFGMPKEAIDLGAANVVLPLDRIAAEIKRIVER